MQDRTMAWSCSSHFAYNRVLLCHVLHTDNHNFSVWRQPRQFRNCMAMHDRLVSCCLFLLFDPKLVVWHARDSWLTSKFASNLQTILQRLWPQSFQCTRVSSRKLCRRIYACGQMLVWRYMHCAAHLHCVSLCCAQHFACLSSL